MRTIVGWDGSGHGLAALKSALGSFREHVFDHVTILLAIWPQREIALWSDIRERQLVVDDVHRAAADIASDDAAALESLLAPFTRSMSSIVTSGEFSAVFLDAIASERADIALIVVGRHDHQGLIPGTLQRVVAGSRIPVWILHAAADA